jgi:hypothetical protein
MIFKCVLLFWISFNTIGRLTVGPLGLEEIDVSGYIGQKIRVGRSAKIFFQIFFTAQILVKINTCAV